MIHGEPRIVSLLPAATEMICGAGLREQLVGISHECNWPPGVARLSRVTREAAALAKRHQWNALPAVERDLVQVVDGDAYFNRPEPRLVESLELTLSAIDGARQCNSASAN